MLGTSFESTAAGKVTEQDFSLGLVFVSDKAEAEEKTAECVFLVVHRFFRGVDAFLISAHLTKGGNEVAVSLDLVCIQSLSKPREGNPVLSDFNRGCVNAQSLFD